jgi:Sugar (and other) transporter.
MWLSLWNVASPIGMMLGSIIGGQFQDRGGRRISLATGAFLSAIAVAICYVADLPDDITARRGVFFVGKIFQGVCLGILLCVVQTYMSEVLPVLLRGPIIAFLPIFTLLGQLIGSVVVYTSLKYPGAESYRIPFASQWPFSAITFLLAAILPESPTWLMRRGRAAKALKAQKRLERPGVDSKAIIEDLRIAILAEEEARGTNTYMDCFRGVNLRRTMVVSLANSLPQLFGLQLLANASYFAQTVGMGSANSLIFLILGIGLGLIANLGSLWVLNGFGRSFSSATDPIHHTRSLVGNGNSWMFPGSRHNMVHLCDNDDRHDGLWSRYLASFPCHCRRNIITATSCQDSGHRLVRERCCSGGLLDQSAVYLQSGRG